MNPAYLWLLVGIGLIVVELTTGTFYLLVLGIGAIAGAIVAWADGGFIAQVIIAGVIALAGTFIVKRWHAKQRTTAFQANLIDVGQAVNVARVVDAASGLLRVTYRGAEWDARYTHDASAHASPAPGMTLYITGQDGQTWIVSPKRPHA